MGEGRDAAQHPAAPRLRAWFSPNGKRKCGLFPNVLGFRFWASAAFSAPRWGSWAQQVGQVAATSRAVISSAADKQVRDCELTSLAPGQGLSNARCYRHSPGQSAHYSLGKGCGDRSLPPTYTMPAAIPLMTIKMPRGRGAGKTPPGGEPPS